MLLSTPPPESFSRHRWSTTAFSCSTKMSARANAEHADSAARVQSRISVGPACRAGIRGHAATSRGRKDDEAATWSGCATHGGSPYGESPFRQKGPTLTSIRDYNGAVPVFDADESCSQCKPGFLGPQPHEWPLQRECHVDNCNQDATHEPNRTGTQKR